jgi:hypothetical protein
VRVNPDSVFNNRSFVLFWLSRVCVSIAVQMQAVLYAISPTTLLVVFAGLKVFPECRHQKRRRHLEILAAARIRP